MAFEAQDGRYQSIIPHSYRSTTAGIAVRSIGKDVVDDFAYLTGAGMASVGTLGVDKDHVWVSAVPITTLSGDQDGWNFGSIPRPLESDIWPGDASGAKAIRRSLSRLLITRVTLLNLERESMPSGLGEVIADVRSDDREDSAVLSVGSMPGVLPAGGVCARAVG